MSQELTLFLIVVAGIIAGMSIFSLLAAIIPGTIIS